MKKLVALFLLFFITPALAQTANNYGFEEGTYADWIVSNGSTAVKTGGWGSNGSGVQVTTGVYNFCPGGGKCWTIEPYGNYMLSIQPGSSSPVFDTAMTSLGLNSTQITDIRTYLTSLGGNSNPTNASWVQRPVYLQAGVTYYFSWLYLSTDYVPFNDGSIMTITGGTGTPTLNGETKNYALLGFTNPGTGNYSVGSYGATGWQVAVFTVPNDGTYNLGFAAFNLGDTALSPILFIDQLQGTTLLNGESFSPIQPNAGSAAPPPPPPGPLFPPVTIAGTQQIKMNQVNSITNNSVYIENYGNYNTVYVEQTSNFNSVRGTNGNPYMLINGNNNNITINQGTSTTLIGQNLAEISIIGSNNILSLTQEHNNNYAEIAVNGLGNNVTLQQRDTGGKSAFLNLDSGNNLINALQEGTGNHFLDITSPAGGSNVSVTQSGSAQKLFSLILNNSDIGVTVAQTNATTPDSVTMSISCTTGPCTGYTYTKN
jgi:hypothetical protein